MQIVSVQTVTIPLEGNAVAFPTPQGLSLRAIKTPAAMQGDTFTFEAGNVDGMSPLHDGSSIYALPCGASRYIPITKKDLFIGPSYLKIVTNNSGSPVGQSATRVFTLFFASE